MCIRDSTYTVQSGDTLAGIRDALVNLINQDPKVTATASGEFTRLILTSRVQGPDANKGLIQTGIHYPVDGPMTSPPQDSDHFVNSIAGGSTADVISATLLPGSVGLYQVLLHLNPSLATDPYAQLTIAQGVYVSNIITLPIVSQ